jgi:hypothetical protein
LPAKISKEMDNPTKNKITRRGLITAILSGVWGMIGISKEIKAKQKNPSNAYGNGNYGGC